MVPQLFHKKSGKHHKNLDDSAKHQGATSFHRNIPQLLLKEVGLKKVDSPKNEMKKIILLVINLAMCAKKDT